ncbi:MAG: nuclear transport factor 2 family protein [bacterium]
MKTHSLIFVISFALTGAALAQENSDIQTAGVIETLNQYVAAVQSKSMPEIEKHVVANEAFSMFEGSHINWGWVDYRDNHLGPELKEFKSIQYSFHDIKTHVSGDMAYATFKSHIAVKMASREVEGESLATAILMKTANGWKIQHMHTSRIPPKKPEEKK